MAEKKEKKTHSTSKIPIDWKEVDKFLIAGCNGMQVASVIGCHEDTLYKRCKEEKKMLFTAYTAKKRQKGNSFLHAKQYKVAMEGNITMLIWLGKQRMEQKEPEKNNTENIKTTFTEMKNAIQDGSLLKMLKQEDDKQ